MPWERRSAGSWPQDEPSEGDAILGAGRKAPASLVPSQPDKIEKGAKDSHRNQLLLAMVASLGYLSVGLVRGFSSPGVPSMRLLDPHLLPHSGASSWISSIPPLGAVVGSLVAGPLLQRIGRRRTLLLSAPIALVAWVVLACAPSYGVLLGARIFTGFCAGLVIPSAQVYVSECSRPSARGVLGSLPALFMSAGILLGYVVGALVPWRWLAGVSAACPAALLGLLLPLPESPSWLAARGRTAEAEAALHWLRRPPLEGIPMADRKTGAAAGGDGEKQNAGDTTAVAASVLTPSVPGGIRAFLRRSVMVPFALALALMVFQQLSGIDAVIFYTVEIFEAAGGGVPEHIAATSVGAVQLGANALALLAVDRAGRRPLLIASGATSGLAMAALGAYFHLHAQGRTEGLGALPLVSLIVFMVGFSIGLCTLPYLMMSEMLPAAQRGALSSAAGCFNLAVMFIVIKTFHDLSAVVGEAGAFWVYAALCVASCFFVLLFVPETKGRSLEEIQEHFERKKTKEITDAESGKRKGEKDKGKKVPKEKEGANDKEVLNERKGISEKGILKDDSMNENQGNKPTAKDEITSDFKDQESAREDQKKVSLVNSNEAQGQEINLPENQMRTIPNETKVDDNKRNENDEAEISTLDSQNSTSPNNEESQRNVNSQIDR